MKKSADSVAITAGYLAPYAVNAAASKGRLLPEAESQFRSPYQRDRDRIIHSGAFRKLKYKTQVFVYHLGDYYRTRLTHTIEVAQIARTLARTLRVDEDLAEAVALAHDLGHTPFGHAGEDALAECMAPYGGFDHNDQALRILTQLEQRYADFDGLNLTWETLEGAVKHNGPLLKKGQKNLPTTIAAYNKQWNLDLASHASIEAQCAAIADDIAYNNHDIDDGLRAGLFTVDDLASLALLAPIIAQLKKQYPDLAPRRMIFEITRRAIGVMVEDVLAQTNRNLKKYTIQSVDDVRKAGRTMVEFSPAIFAACQELRAFLMQHMYRHYRVNRMTKKAARVVAELFDGFMTAPDTLPADWQDQLPNRATKIQRARLIADYIAGMTDNYAMLEHDRLFNPQVKP